MFEKVNPAHPDKIADRIAGAIVDLAYKKEHDPKIAVEVLIGHGACFIVIEGCELNNDDIDAAAKRIAGKALKKVFILPVKQDAHLAENQSEKIRCGDNGIFKGVADTDEQIKLSHIARAIYAEFESDGKYILDGDKLVICQSNASNAFLSALYPNAVINPLGEWTGGTDVDTGATNRKLGSDMGDGITGGGLHGKDLSKADVSVNIYAHLKALATGKTVEISCAIGDDEVDGRPYSEIVEIAREYIKSVGGFEKFAEWGLI